MMSAKILNIQKIFEEEFDSEISDSEEEFGDEEFFHNNDSADIDSEHEKDKIEMDIDEMLPEELEERWFISKDSNEIWGSKPLQCPQGRNKACNILKEIEGPTRRARHNVFTKEDSFLLFFRKHLIITLCKWTNKEGRLIYGNAWKDLSPEEAKKYTGQIILMGVRKSRSEDITQMFGKEVERPVFSKILSRDRFKLITCAMRFDDAEMRRKKAPEDKLAPIREFLETWNNYLRDGYIPGSAMTVDEQLVTYKGRCPFRQFIPSKPGKYGLKFWMLCDTNTSYVWKVQLYSGKKPGGDREINQGERVMKDLVSDDDRNCRCYPSSYC